MKKPISGQFKVDLDTGQVYAVGSKASDKPVKEQQASLLQWGEGRERLEQWQDISEERMAPGELKRSNYENHDHRAGPANHHPTSHDHNNPNKIKPGGSYH